MKNKNNIKPVAKEMAPAMKGMTAAVDTAHVELPDPDMIAQWLKMAKEKNYEEDDDETENI